MSKNKRSEKLDQEKENATTVLNFIKTLRRFDLALYPSGIYYSPDEVFSVWAFAKKYGADSDEKTKE
jgi:hypothetical protein